MLQTFRILLEVDANAVFLRYDRKEEGKFLAYWFITNDYIQLLQTLTRAVMFHQQFLKFKEVVLAASSHLQKKIEGRTPSQLQYKQSISYNVDVAAIL